jgi:tetratricopeptide (TPR) repeat protein
MQKSGRTGLWIFMLFLFLFQLSSLAQSKKYFVINGNIVPEAKETGSGSIDITKNGKETTTIDIPKNGKFRLELDFFNEYYLTFKYTGHFNKIIIVSTDIPQEVWARDNDFPTFPMVVQLLKEFEGIDKSFTLKPSGKIFYGKKIDNFEKESYISDLQFTEQIENAKNKAIQVQKEALTISKEDAQDLAAKQKNFDQLIKEADTHYQRGEFQMALLKYLEAKKLFPEKAYPNDRVAELQDLVKALENTEKQKAELEQKYKSAIAKANGFFDQKNYPNARPGYEEALQYKPGDVFANGRINEIDQLLALLEKQKQYNDLIAQADNNYASKNYDRAIAIYTQAGQLIPLDQYPQKQITLINEAKNQLAKAEQTEKEYSDLIKQADQAFQSNQLDASLAAYNLAIGIKNTESYPKDQINIIGTYQSTVKKADKLFQSNDLAESLDVFNQAHAVKPNETYAAGKIIEIEKRLTQENLYTATLKNADQLFEKKDFINAQADYRKASGLKPEDTYPKEQIRKIDEAIAANLLQEAENAKKIAQQVRMNQAYSAAITEANSNLTAKNYKEAKKKYLEALEYQPDSEYPKNQIAKIDEVLTQEEAQAQTKKEFDNAFAEGENLLAKKELAKAKDAYTRAYTLIPSEILPPKRINEINDLIAEQAKKDSELKSATEAYLAAIRRADEYFGNKEYASARLIYTEALLLKADEKYPVNQLALIDKLMKEQNEQLYKTALTKADNAFNANQFDDAIALYTEALQYKKEDQYATRRIKESNQKKADQIIENNRLKKLQEQYDAILADAANDFKNKSYLKSKEKYQKALTLKPSEEFPKEQIARIDKLINELQNEEEINRQYLVQINAAQLAFSQKKLKEALTAYQNARDLKPSETLPPLRINEIDQMLALADETARLTAMEEAQRLAKEKADRDHYTKAVEAGDKSFAAKEYPIARTHYTTALVALPNEKYPRTQIDKIDELISLEELEKSFARKKAEQDSLKNLMIQKFDLAVKTAKEHEQNKRYLPAIEKYKEAIRINPSQNPTIQKLIRTIEDQIQLLARQESEYQRIIKLADKLFTDSKLNEALIEYRNAVTIKAEEEYPKNQIREIQSVLTARDQNYTNAIQNGDKAFDSADWMNAKSAYTEALAFKPFEVYPVTRLKTVNQKIADLKIASANILAENKAYTDAMAKAEKSLKDEQLATARIQFEVAKSLSPNEKLPAERIREIDVLLEQRSKDRLAQTQRDIDDKYRQAISVADNSFREKTYNIAKLQYQQALLIKPDESYPKNQMALIDKLMNVAAPVETYSYNLPDLVPSKPAAKPLYNPEESAQSTEARARSFVTITDYDEAIKKADDSFGIKDYSVARFFYLKASDIKPKEEYPINQVELIRKLIDSQLSGNDLTGYEQSIAQADAAFSKENYNIAKFFYYKAIEIKSWEKYPNDRILEIAALTHSLLSEKEEKEYRDVIAKGDEAYFNKDVSIARFYYNKAISIKKDETYPRIKLKDIQKLIEQDKQDQQNLEYRNLIEQADQALKLENYSIARFNYNKALTLKPDENYPKDQLKQIKEVLAKPNK